MQVEPLVEHRVDDGEAHRAAEIAGDVEQAGGVFQPFRRQGPERQIVDRDHHQHQRNAPEHLRHEQFAKVPVAGDEGRHERAPGEAEKPKPDHPPRIDLGQETADDWRRDELAKAGGEHGLADLQGRHASDAREIDRVKIGEAIEARAEHEGGERSRPKIAVDKGREVDDRVFRGEGPPEEDAGAGGGEAGRPDDRRIVEPVFRRPLLQKVFERPEKARHGKKSGPVEILQKAAFRPVEVDQQPGRDGDEQPRAYIDQEQPAPRKEIGEIAADRRSNGRRERGDKPDDRRDHRRLVAREDRIGRGEDGGDHAAADKTLQRPPDDHLVEAGRGRAGQTHQGEARRGNREHDAGGESARQEARQGNHHHFGDEIACLHPGDFVGAGRESGLDRSERRRDDLDVEDRHEHAEDHAQEGEHPAVRIMRLAHSPPRLAIFPTCCLIWPRRRSACRPRPPPTCPRAAIPWRPRSALSARGSAG